MKYSFFIACLLCLAVPPLTRAQSGAARTKGAAATKPAPIAAAKADSSLGFAAPPSEQRDTLDHVDNPIEDTLRNADDGDQRYDGGDSGAERGDGDNKRGADDQPGNSDQGGNDIQE
jgi:hypothetical protein